MGRPPKIRPHYNQDALFLMRLAGAIERDKLRPKPWREETISTLQLLAKRLMEAPKPRKPYEEEKAA